MFLRRIGFLWDLLYPPRCASCGRFLIRDVPGPDPEKPGLGDPEKDFALALGQDLCRDCLQACSPLEPPHCTRCGAPFTSRQGVSHVCGPCLKNPPRFNHARAAGAYSESLARTIQAFKYGGRMEMARPLGRLLGLAFDRHARAWNIDVAVPVPLHAKRLRERGFNQAALLIRDWRKTDLPPVAMRAMERNRYTAVQAGLGKRARTDNIRGAFSLRQASAIEGKSVLLVDDVLTTGATANECAKTLLDHGAAEVNVLTLAVVP